MQNYPLVNKIKINKARSEFFRSGALPAGVVPDTILRSWQRSQANGVQVEVEPDSLPVLSRHELAGLTAQNRTFLDQSLPVMENLYEQIQNSSSMVILANATGVILHCLGDADFMDRARRVSLIPGGVWSESLRGTNAIGTALAEQSPVVVHSYEHVASANNFLTCSASPIFDPFGALLGVLDVSGESRTQQQHTMALVRISAQQIENQMFSTGFEQDCCLHFHSRPEFIGTLYEAIVVFDAEGKVLAANRSALLHLSLDRYQARSLGFADLFGQPFEALCTRSSGTVPQPVLQLRTGSGTLVFGRMRVPTARGGGGGGGGEARLTATRTPAAGAGAPITLESLDLGDPAMQRVTERARRVLGFDIPLLIEGESGTGKELFAQALHNSGPRCGAPFVALNCAAIPEGLIEAELFGYQEGAFTGARRKGNPGRIRQADGGTLFLDEIGDMPLSLQARLLRVLQERSVTPLGGGETFPVDIAVVCATNRKLRDEIAAGRFREDLYYRLNGLLVSLPRLRDREDRLRLAHAMVRELAGADREVRLGHEVAAIIENHPWPGNIRQLHSVLRTAVALLGSWGEIAAEHLPEDFLEQYRKADAPAPGPRELPGTGSHTNLHRLEGIAIRKAIGECGGNLSAAARALGVSRTTLYRKTKEMSIPGRDLQTDDGLSRFGADLRRLS